MFVMNPLKLLPVWLLESQPVIFQTQQLRCICVLKSHLRYENRTCEVEVADAQFEVADAFWNRSCVFKTHLRPELRRCDFRIAGAKLTSQLRSAARLWHLLRPAAGLKLAPKPASLATWQQLKPAIGCSCAHALRLTSGRGTSILTKMAYPVQPL